MFHGIDQWLETIPAVAVCIIVGLFVMIESLGIPFPAETILIAVVGLVSQHALHVPVIWIGVAAAAAAVIGDSIGFAIGHKWGGPLFDWLGRKFPKHFGPEHIAYAERVFQRWGMVAVFFGRFVALLRTFAGPIAGTLKMPYPKFLIANVSGGIVWAGTITSVIYFVGQAADKYFGQFSWVILAVAIVGGIVIGVIIKRRTTKAAKAAHEKPAAEVS
ncbi:MAG TPA: DedA family protein [Pseudonocardiaceae bacterium]